MFLRVGFILERLTTVAEILDHWGTAFEEGSDGMLVMDGAEFVSGAGINI